MRNCIYGGKSCWNCGICGAMAGEYAASSPEIPKLFLKRLQHAEDGYGIAFDIGTTTIAGYLCDLKERLIIAHQALTNPQIVHGSLASERLAYAGESPENADLLKKLITDRLNELANKLLGRIDASAVSRVAVAGNPVMCRLLSDVSDISLPNAVPFIFPGLSDAVGGDVTAGLLAADVPNLKGNNLYVDIGTSIELVLTVDGKLFVCRSNAGPVFEGGGIERGMRAVPGAINKLKITDVFVRMDTVKQEIPRGICGAGIADAAASLLSAGISGPDGDFISAEEAKNTLSRNIASLLHERSAGRSYELYPSIDFTEKDMKNVLRAVQAVSSDILNLAGKAGIALNQIDRVFLACPYANHIQTSSAVALGIIPGTGEDSIFHAGNAAGIGACMALLSPEVREKAEKLSEDAVSVPPSDVA